MAPTAEVKEQEVAASEMDLTCAALRFAATLIQSPLGFNAGDANLYRYVSNNPTNATDPSGLEIHGPRYNPYGGPGIPRPAVPFPARGAPPTIVTNIPGGAIADTWNPFASTTANMRANNPFTPANTPIPIPAASLPPVGPGTNVAGGTHQIFPPLRPGQFVGTGGCGPSVGVIIQCPGRGAVVFHFGTLNSAVAPTINRYDWPSGCRAIICGGSSAAGSNVVMYWVISVLRGNGITLDGILPSANCFLGSDGSWYFDPRPHAFTPDP